MIVQICSLFFFTASNGTQFIKDCYHLKKTVWVEQVGEPLYIEHRTHLEDAFNCLTQQEYNHHMSVVYKCFKAYPEHIKYIKGYFDNP